MAYSNSAFEEDAVKVARVLHLSFRRCEYLLDRWYAGANTAFPAETYADLNNLMNRVAEMVSDYEASSNAKLNTVLAVSDLQLPGDA
jgi:hypothetical protein